MATDAVNPNDPRYQNTTQNYRPDAGNSGVVTKDTSPQTTSTTGSSSTNQTSTEITDYFDPKTKESLDHIIQQLLSGGTKEQKADRQKRTALMSFVEQMLGQYSKQAAFDDAQNLMNLNIQQSMQKNMPAIARSIEGAGTSASSMQGLLSQNLARDTALGAGALGADQAKAYAGASTNLASVLEALSRPDNSIASSLIQALNVAKGGTITRNTSQTGSSNQTQNQVQGGKTETITSVPSGQVGGNNPYSGSSIGQKQSSGVGLLDWAAAMGYGGDLRPFTSYSDSGQSLATYTQDARGFSNPSFAIVGNGTEQQ